MLLIGYKGMITAEIEIIDPKDDIRFQVRYESG